MDDSDRDPKKPEGKRIKPVRWSIESASSEFGINPRTLSMRIKTRGIEVGGDGRWSTNEIHEAICGSLEKEKLKKLAAERETAEIAVARLRKEVVAVADVERVWSTLVMNFRQRMLQIPGKVSSRLVYCKGESEYEKEILQEIEEALIELSKTEVAEEPKQETQEEE